MSLTEQRHGLKMARKKAQVDKAIAQAQQKKGLCLVLTGHGKGKSTSAFGMVARALGHGLTVAVCQFIKSRTDTGEEAFFKSHCHWHVLGDGFTWETQNLAQDKATALRGWQVAQHYLQDPAVDVVVLDELTYLLSYHYLDEPQVLDALQHRPPHQHVIITGRNAKTGLLEIADTVSDIKAVKHGFQAGIQAQAGFDF